MSKLISVSMDKNFIMAKVFIPYDKNDARIKVEVRQGYNLYYQDNGALNNGLNPSKEMQIPKNGSVTLYWIKQNYCIRVPFGFKICNYGVNGTVTLLIDTTCGVEKFLQKFPILNWETEYRDGVAYQYLAEYFIDSERKQNGIAITIRNMLMPVLQAVVEQFKEENFVDRQNDLKELIEKVVNAYFDPSKQSNFEYRNFVEYFSSTDYGLRYQSVTVSVISKGDAKQ